MSRQPFADFLVKVLIAANRGCVRHSDSKFQEYNSTHTRVESLCERNLRTSIPKENRARSGACVGDNVCGNIARGRGVPRWGNLRRLKPFSNNFGWERGTPVDRYYVDRFFERHRGEDFRRCSRDRSQHSTSRFGHDLRTVHSFDIEPKPGTTFACDLAHSENVLESEAYNCVLLPCSLLFFRELDLCLRNTLRVLRPRRDNPCQRFSHYPCRRLG